jgi:pilus assembly protein CpaE
MPMDQLGTLATTSQPPDALVLDLRGLSDVPAALGLVKRQHPLMGVVIVATELNPALMLSAMRAGVNECVTEPLNQGDLEAAITRVVGRTTTAAAASQVFAFIGAKGGVGASTLAVNVATTLARSAISSALLIDLHNGSGDAGLYLGVEPRFSVMDALESIHKLDEAYMRSLVTKGPGRLELLAASEHPLTSLLDTGRVRSLLEFVSKTFEFAVVDVPRTETGALDALDGVKSIVVVTTQELPAARSATRLAAKLRQRYGKDRVLIVVSRVDQQSDITFEDVERVLGSSVAHALPSDYRLSTASLNSGRPVVLDNRSKLAGSMKSFASALAGLKTQATTTPASPGWLERLRRRK